jgi:hypothetical protein
MNHTPLPATVNTVNLLRMADHIETVNPELFGMRFCREGGENTHECNSVGCIIGHCVILDEWKNVPLYIDGDIKFVAWSEQFTGISRFRYLWTWLFGYEWTMPDNTPTGAAARIRYTVKHGLPENWDAQMDGDAPLCYTKTT